MGRISISPTEVVHWQAPSRVGKSHCYIFSSLRSTHDTPGRCAAPAAQHTAHARRCAHKAAARARRCAPGAAHQTPNTARAPLTSPLFAKARFRLEISRLEFSNPRFFVFVFGSSAPRSLLCCHQVWKASGQPLCSSTWCWQCRSCPLLLWHPRSRAVHEPRRVARYHETLADQRSGRLRSVRCFCCSYRLALPSTPHVQPRQRGAAASQADMKTRSLLGMLA